MAGKQATTGHGVSAESTTPADPDRIHWPDLVAEGIEARRTRDGAQWRLGDLALEVETTYGGHELERYAEDVGVEYNTLRDYRDTAKAYGIDERSSNLSWSHHRAVRSQSDRQDWIRQAIEKRWSVRTLTSHAIALSVQTRLAAERQLDVARERLRLTREWGEELGPDGQATDAVLGRTIASTPVLFFSLLRVLATLSDEEFERGADERVADWKEQIAKVELAFEPMWEWQQATVWRWLFSWSDRSDEWIVSVGKTAGAPLSPIARSTRRLLDEQGLAEAWLAELSAVHP
jgi:hypothetical protein